MVFSQVAEYLEVFEEVISDLHSKGALPQICEVEFSWFPGSKSGEESCKPGSQLINGIIVRPGKKIGECHCSTPSKSDG